MNWKAWLAIGLLLAPVGSAAEVVDSAANGFTVRATVNIQAAPAEVYARLLRIGEWWAPAHTFSGDARNLSLDAKPMGCFCEKLPPQGGVRHMEVLFVEPGKTLRMSGAMGPLQALAAAATMTIQLAPAGEGTRLEATYAVSGYFPKGVDSWVQPVDTMLGQQCTRLKNYVEHGSPTAGEPPAK